MLPITRIQSQDVKIAQRRWGFSMSSSLSLSGAPSPPGLGNGAMVQKACTTSSERDPTHTRYASSPPIRSVSQCQVHIAIIIGSVGKEHNNCLIHG